MDKVSELLEQIATLSVEMNKTIDDEIKDDIDRFALLTKTNAMDFEIHEIRKHLEEIKRA